MKKAITITLLISFIYPSFSTAKTLLKFSTWHPAVSKEVQTVWQPMLKKIEKESGSIKTINYAGGALGKGAEHYDIIKDGMSDLGYFTLTWTPGKFPLAEALSMAMRIDSKETAAAIGYELYKRELLEEFQDVHLLELNSCIQAYLWTKNPLRNLQSHSLPLKGLKIRTPGGMQTRYIKSLGAEPVFMPLGDVYTALETGAIDGVVTCPPLLLAFKLYEVVKHGVPATFGCVAEGVAINKKTWSKLDSATKKIVAKNTNNPFAIHQSFTASTYEKMLRTLQAKGVVLHTIDQETEHAWYTAFQEVTRKWASEQKNPAKAKQVVITLAEIATKNGSKAVAVPPEWQKSRTP